MKNSLKNATIDHHYFEKQNAIHLGEVLSVWFHIKQRNLPHSPEHGRLSMSTLKRQLIPFLYFLLPDEVSTLVAVLHQRHRSNEFASPIDIILFETADVQDEMWRHTHFLAHPLDICLRVVLVRSRPPLNDGAHGIAVVLHSIRPQQSEGSPVAPLHCLELIKALVVLHFQQTFPLILASADVQWIAITNSSWYHNS